MIIRIAITYLIMITVVLANTEQLTTGNKSPIINSSGSGAISINYSENPNEIKKFSFLELLQNFSTNENTPQWSELIDKTNNISWISEAGYLDKKYIEAINDSSILGREGKVNLSIDNALCTRQFS